MVFEVYVCDFVKEQWNETNVIEECDDVKDDVGEI